MRGSSWIASVLSLSAGCTLLVRQELDRIRDPDEDGGSESADAGDSADVATGDGGEPADADVALGGQDAAEDAIVLPRDDGGTPALERERVKLTLGVGHACALFASGHFDCWGSMDQEEGFLPAEHEYQDIAAGDYHTCAITREGELVCAGSNAAGQRVNEAGPFEKVAAGDAHTCALDLTGRAHCWGKNTNRQATPPLTEFSAISAGTAFTCGIRRPDSKVECWGSSSSNRTNPPTDVAFTAIECGDSHSCGVTQDSTVTCWGNIAFRAPALTNVVSIGAGDIVSCAVLMNGSARCWPDTVTIPSNHYLSVTGGRNATCFVGTTAGPVCVPSASGFAAPPANFFGDGD